MPEIATEDEITARRFGQRGDKPCLDPNTLLCTLYRCQEANECRYPWREQGEESMSDDLPYRLRVFHQDLRMSSGFTEGYLARLLEAADEIERLRELVLAAADEIVRCERHKNANDTAPNISREIT